MRIPHIIEQAKKFMEAPEKTIIKMFSSLPNAQIYAYQEGRPIIFIPGTRKDRVLLVAHYDTVWMTPRHGENRVEMTRRVRVDGFLLHSAEAGRGIGADDRLGCLALWSLRDTGHSLLLVPDEEIGCLGSRKTAAEYVDQMGLRNHQFMMQFDRRGAYDLVYYSFDNPELHKFLLGHFPGFSKAYGSCTDIVQLIPATGVAGVNVSIGFNSEHTENERVDIFDFIRTVAYTKKMLEGENLPSFRYTAPKYESRPSYYSLYDDGEDYPSTTVKKATPLKLPKSNDIPDKITGWERAGGTKVDNTKKVVNNKLLYTLTEIIPFDDMSSAAHQKQELAELANEDYSIPDVFVEDRDGNILHFKLSPEDHKASSNNWIKDAIPFPHRLTCCDHCGYEIPEKGFLSALDGSVKCLLCGYIDNCPDSHDEAQDLVEFAREQMKQHFGESWEDYLDGSPERFE